MTDLLSKKNTKSECNIPTIGSDRSDGSFARLSQEFVFFVIGDRLFHNREFLTKNKTQQLAMDAFLKGCVQEGCVPCMFYYCHMQLALGRVHLALPWLLEGAIRGHLPCQHRLVNECYNEAAPEEVNVLSNFWAKILISHGFHYITEDMRNDARTKNGNHCFSCGKKEHSAADTAVAADGSSSLPLSKFTDPDSGVDITVTPHRRNPEPKEEAISKKSRSKDEDGVLDISVIPPWRRKEVTPATVKHPTPTHKQQEDETKGKFYEKEGISIDYNPASRTTTTTTTVDVCKVTGTPVINRGHEPTFTSPPKFLGSATTPHSRREATAQEKLLKKTNEHDSEEETSSSSFLMPTTSAADTAVICGIVTPTTTTTSTSPTTSISTSDGGSASVTTPTPTVTLEKCGYCKYYSYCGKECQLKQWYHTHMNQCRHLKKLRKYYKPYAKSIRAQLTSAQDPKSIPQLQILRAKLGLTRPISQEYTDLFALLEAQAATVDKSKEVDKTISPNRYEYLVARKDGTVHVGSTTNII